MTSSVSSPTKEWEACGIPQHVHSCHPGSQNQRDQRTVSLLSSYAEGELIVLEVLPLALTRVRDTEYSRRGEGEDDAAGLDVLSDLFPASPVNVEKVKHTVERVSK